ncbi:DENN domain and WD repeat-containing protein SCD1 [Vitis vinifera]|uniref:DENN domain and WD repeat-containing protein SCD1 n=1 Tax=Vitis vinifera TaxID=29760 RepID=A0A438JYY7_VITVI|nr:DENN domain and WD repeat-containing protein SCD1 [Vitis vinifera]
MGQTWSCCCLCCCRDELVDLARICVLPAGVEFYSSGFDSNDVSTFPRSYPIVLTGVITYLFSHYPPLLLSWKLICLGHFDMDNLDPNLDGYLRRYFGFLLNRPLLTLAQHFCTYVNWKAGCCEGDGSKIYVSCIAFRDPVSDDIAEAYRIPPNSFADKCICLVSRLPSFCMLRNALEELFALCFSPTGSSKPLWDVIEYMVSNVPLPTPGKDRVLFAIENCLLSVEAPPKEGLPHADV